MYSEIIVGPLFLGEVARKLGNLQPETSVQRWFHRTRSVTYNSAWTADFHVIKDLLLELKLFRLLILNYNKFAVFTIFLSFSSNV